MKLDETRTLYQYNDWANERLTSMLRTAFGEETDLRKNNDTRLRSIQETAAHIFVAQAIWRNRVQGVSPTASLDPAEYPTPLALRFAFGAERARFWGFLESLPDDAALLRPVAYQTMQGVPYTQPLEQILQHVLMHSMYHRGQITARLIDMGHESALLTTDLIAFYHDTQS